MILYYGSLLLIPLLVYLVVWRRRAHYTKGKKIIWVLTIALIICGIYARFIEPQIIITRSYEAHTLGDVHSSAARTPARIAIIADMHVGIYKSAAFLERLVAHINKLENIDSVLIAGDFLYDPARHDLEELLAPLAMIESPVYAVLGNHDVGHPGVDARTELEEILPSLGITLIEHQVIEREGYTLVGLPDYWEQPSAPLPEFQRRENQPVIGLMHNPDSAYSYPGDAFDLIVTGHTHCGQVRIPGTARFTVPTTHPFYDIGLHEIVREEGVIQKVYVSCGTGEVGLPLRLFNPPVIDIITL